MKFKELKKIATKIEKHKNKIAQHRDAIRDIYDDIGGMLESFDVGEQWLDEGVKLIIDGIDSISEVV